MNMKNILDDVAKDQKFKEKVTNFKEKLRKILEKEQ